MKSIMKTSPYGSPMNLVFAGCFIQKYEEVPSSGASNKAGVGKISSFLFLSTNISKTVADTVKITIND